MTTTLITLITAVLAGGFINQLFNILFGDKINIRRDFKKWRRVERYQVYCQLLDLISTSQPEFGKDKWPGKVRSLSQKIYLLHDNGHPNKGLCISLEEIFQLTNEAKKDTITEEILREKLRTVGSKLRRELAISLENDK
jgi:hypothetical protein